MIVCTVLTLHRNIVFGALKASLVPMHWLVLHKCSGKMKEAVVFARKLTLLLKLCMGFGEICQISASR